MVANKYQGISAAEILGKRPAAPDITNFSSGPTQPILTLEEAVEVVRQYHQGSHRNGEAKKKFAELNTLLRETLEIPEGWHIIPVNGGDTHAFEALQYECTGAKPVIGIGHENFGHKWLKNLAKMHIKEDIDYTPIKVGYGEIAHPDFETLKTSDLQFVPNGTTSGVRYTNFDWIPDKSEREGLVFADVTSFYLANKLPFDKVNAFTFSMQKAAGSEGGLGFIVCDDAVIKRINEYNPDRYILSPASLRTESGAYNAALEEPAGIANTNSMLVVEHVIHSLRKIKDIGVDKYREISDKSLEAFREWTGKSDWIEFLAKDPATVSNTSPCFSIKDEWFKSLNPKEQVDTIKEVNTLLLGKDSENSIELAKDNGAYKAAPAGFRLWIGGSVPTESAKQVAECVDWAYALTKQRFVEREQVLEGKPTLVIVDKVDAEELKKFRESGEFKVVYIPEILSENPKFDWQSKYLEQADYLVVRSTEVRKNRKDAKTIVLDDCKNLKGIVRGGSGLDNIDLEEAASRGIEVSPTKGSNAYSTAQASFVAELKAMGLKDEFIEQIYDARKLGAAKQAVIDLAGQNLSAEELANKKGIKSQFFGDCVVPQEEFLEELKRRCPDLAKGQHVAVIGAGHIGKWKAQMFAAIGADVTVYNRSFEGGERPATKAELEAAKIRTTTDIKEACLNANLITVHVDLNDQTKGILKQELVNVAANGVVIGNYGRPALVENGAINLVVTGKAKAYVCDGAPKEVCPIVIQLGDKAKDCEIVPHVGAESKQSLKTTTQAAFAKIIDMSKRALGGEIDPNQAHVDSGPGRGEEKAV